MESGVLTSIEPMATGAEKSDGKSSTSYRIENLDATVARRAFRDKKDYKITIIRDATIGLLITY
uniref:Uncharacterized protein n=1 Tax=Romanomermis culicivorax TaxID=13658 RepID=A0A915HZ31_ROMCU